MGSASRSGAADPGLLAELLLSIGEATAAGLSADDSLIAEAVAEVTEYLRSRGWDPLAAGSVVVFATTAAIAITNLPFNLLVSGLALSASNEVVGPQYQAEAETTLAAYLDSVDSTIATTFDLFNNASAINNVSVDASRHRVASGRTPPPRRTTGRQLAGAGARLEREVAELRQQLRDRAHERLRQQLSVAVSIWAGRTIPPLAGETSPSTLARALAAEMAGVDAASQAERQARAVRLLGTAIKAWKADAAELQRVQARAGIAVARARRLQARKTAAVESGPRLDEPTLDQQMRPRIDRGPSIGRL